MYILVVTRGYPTEKYKMNGIFEFDQAKALVNAGLKVVYAAIDLRSIRRTRKWGFESFVKDGVQIEAINIPCGKMPKMILDKVCIIALNKLYNRIIKKYGKPDLIHAHFIRFGYITARVFEKTGIPLVLTEHLSSMNKKELPPYLTRLGKYTYPRMNQVISVSNCLAENIKDKFGIQPISIPNVVDLQNFNYKIKRKNDNSFIFVSTGSLIFRKGMDLLVESFYKAFKDNKNVKLYIFGEGPERNNLEKLINRLQLYEQIFLMGLVDRKEIADKMSESDCFVLASRRETFGVVYIEAMTMGLPVIATRCGGPEDFVTAKNGILVPVNDPIALTNALRKIYENIETYDRQAISTFAKKMFAPSTIAQQLIDVYRKIIY